MSNNNDNGKYWTRYLVGIIWAIVFGSFVTLTNYVVSNDEDSRERDIKVETKCVDMVNDACIRQEQTNKEILKTLTELTVDIKWIKKNAKIDG